MCKLDLLKKSLITIRETLKRYETLIPGGQKQRYEKDISMIFNNLDNSFEEKELSKMDKLAKTKLKSIQRVYGVLREETTQESKKFSFLDEETENYLIKTFNIDPKEKIKSKFDQLKNSAAFNPNLVKQYQQSYSDEKIRIEEAYLKVMNEKENKNSKNNKKTFENILSQGKELDLSKCRDKEGNVIKSKLKEAVLEIMKMNGFPDAEQRAEEFDYDSMERQVQNGEELDIKMPENPLTEQFKKVNEMANTKKTEELFSVFSEKKNLSEQDMNKFNEKIRPIIENKNLTDDEKMKLYLEETKKAEEDWNSKNLDGFISYDMYGEFKFKFFKKEEEKSKEENKNNEDNKSNSQGVKNFVWRDGKLVEGKAKERNVVTYSNWHAGHHNPDDLRKHRELLDRQHYGGPLWDGIKYKGLLTDKKDIVIPGPTPEDMENLEKNQINVNFKKGDNKPEIIEVVR